MNQFIIYIGSIKHSWLPDLAYCSATVYYAIAWNFIIVDHVMIHGIIYLIDLCTNYVVFNKKNFLDEISNYFLPIYLEN